MNFATGLVFTLLVATIPIVTAVISLAGFIYGALGATVQEDIIKHIQHIFPPPIPSEEIVSLALNSLNKNAGFLGIITIVLAVFGGSGLFITMEGYFDIIYRVRTRSIVPRYVMAISMILVFVILTPLWIFADTLPAVVHALLQATPLDQTVSNDLLLNIVGTIAGLFVSWVLFEAIYLVVPNRRISFRHSWPEALLAAMAARAYFFLFPYYVTHFLSNYAGTIGFVIIFLCFFYYFALILLSGAEINAFFAEGIPATSENLAGIVQDYTSPPLHA